MQQAMSSFVQCHALSGTHLLCCLPPAPPAAVTAMATSHSRWAVVMSRNAGFVDQVRAGRIDVCMYCRLCKGGMPARAACIRLLRASHSTPWYHPSPLPCLRPTSVCQCVELDFQYPSEGIHRRWDAGYRITSCAATPDQAAFVLRCGSARWG